MQFIIFAAMLAVSSAAPAQLFINSGLPITSFSKANNVIEPQFSQGVVGSNLVPTLYSGVGNSFQQGQYFGGVPGTYVANTKLSGVAPIATVAQPAAIQYSAQPIVATQYATKPIVATQYSAQQPIFATQYSAQRPLVATQYSAQPIIGNTQFVGQPSVFVSGQPATFYSAQQATNIALPATGLLPKTVQQNEGVSLTTF